MIDFRAGRRSRRGRRSSRCSPGPSRPAPRLGLEIEPSGAKRRPARPRGARRRGLDRGHLPRRRRRDPPHLRRRQTGGLAPFAGRLRAVSPVPHIDSRAAKPSRRKPNLTELPDRIRSRRRACLRGGGRALRTARHPAPARKPRQATSGCRKSRAPSRRAPRPTSTVSTRSSPPSRCRSRSCCWLSRTTRPRSAS